MIGKETYKIYAPDGTKWTEWIRPVPFVAIDTYNRLPISNWLDRKYRPIPLFNGTDEQIGSQATTNTYLIESCLINGSEKENIILIGDKNA